MTARFAPFFALCLAMLLGACASPRFEADVARFHNLTTGIASGQSVEIAAADPAQADAAFSRHADIIGERLAAQGFAPPTPGQPSDLIALVSYASERRALVDERGGSPVSIGVGVGGGGRNVGGGIGTVFGLGEPRESAVYLRTLEIRLKERATGATVFEARAMSEGESGDIGTVMPYLADAIFAEFPGPAGQTTHFERKLD